MRYPIAITPKTSAKLADAAQNPAPVATGEKPQREQRREHERHALEGDAESERGAENPGASRRERVNGAADGERDARVEAPDRDHAQGCREEQGLGQRLRPIRAETIGGPDGKDDREGQKRFHLEVEGDEIGRHVRNEQRWKQDRRERARGIFEQEIAPGDERPGRNDDAVVDRAAAGARLSRGVAGAGVDWDVTGLIGPAERGLRCGVVESRGEIVSQIEENPVENRCSLRQNVGRHRRRIAILTKALDRPPVDIEDAEDQRQPAEPEPEAASRRHSRRP